MLFLSAVPCHCWTSPDVFGGPILPATQHQRLSQHLPPPPWPGKGMLCKAGMNLPSKNALTPFPVGFKLHVPTHTPRASHWQGVEKKENLHIHFAWLEMATALPGNLMALIKKKKAQNSCMGLFCWPSSHPSSPFPSQTCTAELLPQH